ncbi:MAG: hypothetical protein ACRCT1_11670 [Microcoleaceae cyanobacterium]
MCGFREETRFLLPLASSFFLLPSPPSPPPLPPLPPLPSSLFLLPSSRILLVLISRSWDRVSFARRWQI